MENIIQKRNKSSSQYGMILPYIPYEILVDILLRVPATSLVRFKCVSKSLHALISSPEFITAHVKINRELKKKCLIISAFDPTTYKLIPIKSLLKHRNDAAAAASQKDPAAVTAAASGSSSSKRMNIEHGVCISSSSKRMNIEHGECMTCSCDGLICFFRKPNHIRIWNPITRQFRNLPLLKPKKPGYLEFIGFGYYEPANDYKVLAIQCPHDNKDNYYEDNCVLQIYSLNTHRWETTVKYCFYFGIPSRSSIYGVFLNNKPYWLENSFAEGICSFDLDSCKFEQIEEPHDSSCWGLGGEYERSLGVLDGHLCVGYDKFYTMDLWLVKKKKKKEINVKKDQEYTWMKFVSINHFRYFDVLPTIFVPKHRSHVLDVFPISYKGNVIIIVEDKYGKHWLMYYDSQNVSSQRMLAIPTNAEVQMKALFHVPSLISI